MVAGALLLLLLPYPDRSVDGFDLGAGDAAGLHGGWR
jgi:hypothetical protein